MRGKRALRRAVRLALVVGAAWYRGRRYTRADAAQLLPGLLTSEPPQLRHQPEELDREPARNDATCFKERTVRLWSFNAESLRRVGRLEELLELAKAEDVAIFTMQGTQMDLGMTWQSCGYSVHSRPRS
eukprot:5212427-Pyramimonas_sp.AAC.1